MNFDDLRIWAFLVLATILPYGAIAVEPPKLAPNAKLTFEFPDLTPTFFAQSAGDNHPAALSAQLPDNYSKNRKFPIFVFIAGGSGGRGDSNGARGIVGARDFICVGLPLFKDKPTDRPPPLPGVKVDWSKLVNDADGPLLAKSYRVMLEKLFAVVPNITSEHSAIGGFSNGGHATAALIAVKDSFILDHFDSYVFYEGGMALAFTPDLLKQPQLQKSRFLMLMGDVGENPGRALVQPLVAALADKAAKAPQDFKYVIMRGYGHTMPPEYTKLVGNWLRGERLPEVAPKPQQ